MKGYDDDEVFILNPHSRFAPKVMSERRLPTHPSLKGKSIIKVAGSVLRFLLWVSTGSKMVTLILLKGVSFGQILENHLLFRAHLHF